MATDAKTSADLLMACRVIGSSSQMLIEDNVHPVAVCGALLTTLNCYLNAIQDEEVKAALRKLYSESLATGNC